MEQEMDLKQMRHLGPGNNTRKNFWSITNATDKEMPEKEAQKYSHKDKK